MVTAIEVILEGFYLCLEIFVVTATVVIFQIYCVVRGDYFGYSNRRFSALVL